MAADGQPAPETICEVLRNRRRRRTVRYISRNTDATVRELADHLAATEAGKPLDEVTYDERKRVRNALYQHHLPKMAEYGVVEYDRSRGTVTATGETRELCDCLVLLRRRRRCSLFTLALGALTGSLVTFWLTQVATEIGFQVAIIGGLATVLSASLLASTFRDTRRSLR